MSHISELPGILCPKGTPTCIASHIRVAGTLEMALSWAAVAQDPTSLHTLIRQRMHWLKISPKHCVDVNACARAEVDKLLGAVKDLSARFFSARGPARHGALKSLNEAYVQLLGGHAHGLVDEDDIINAHNYLRAEVALFGARKDAEFSGVGGYTADTRFVMEALEELADSTGPGSAANQRYQRWYMSALTVHAAKEPG